MNWNNDVTLFQNKNLIKVLLAHSEYFAGRSSESHSRSLDERRRQRNDTAAIKSHSSPFPPDSSPPSINNGATTANEDTSQNRAITSRRSRRCGLSTPRPRHPITATIEENGRRRRRRSKKMNSTETISSRVKSTYLEKRTRHWTRKQGNVFEKAT